MGSALEACAVTSYMGLWERLGLELQDINIAFLPPRSCEKHGQGAGHVTDEHYRKKWI